MRFEENKKSRCFPAELQKLEKAKMKVAEWISSRAGEYSKLAEVATKRDILTLVRCGVRYDDDTNGKLVISV